MTLLNYIKNTTIVAGLAISIGNVGVEVYNLQENKINDGQVPDNTLTSMVLDVDRTQHFDCNDGAYAAWDDSCTEGVLKTRVDELSDYNLISIFSEDLREDIASEIELGYELLTGFGLIVLGTLPLYFSRKDNWLKRFVKDEIK
jgi:hypothetical protein